MVRLREIPRTAAFAWSPLNNSPWVVTGTKAGAVDIDFSNETSLELWDLGLDDATQGQELQPRVTIPTEVGFHDLAWTAYENYPKGIIAGALDNGCLGLWDAEKLLTDPSNSSILYKKIHSGAIKALQFNPRIPNFLASGGAKGELFITDLNNLKDPSPTRLGSTAARADDIECLDWNKKVPNILVTGSSGGFVTVWDMKTKKESLTLNNNGRKAVSAVAWDPEKPTRLITAVPLEQEPIILVWDLRNSNAPEKVMRGHDNGVLSLSWCPQDSDLLLSCGKDNRTILWNPQTGQALGDYPVVTNWTFQTRWNPKNPNLFATASFDGKLLIQTLQNTNPGAVQQDSNQIADGEDFFSKAQTQPQSSSFSLLKAPKWLERPASVSFGFGGRLISVKPAETGKRGSQITISKFEVDSSVGQATDEFEKAIESGSLSDICKSRAADAKSDAEKSDWQVIETLLSQNPRKELVKSIGFDDADQATDGIAKLGLTESPASEPKEPAKTQFNGAGRGHRRFESVFANSADGDFLSQLAATQSTKTYKPFQLFTGSETETDRTITRAIMLGQFEKALDICLSEDRMSDAFMLAICGGEKCIKKAQEAYFAKQDSGPNYLRLLASIVGKSLWDTVHNADIQNWKEVMATICTFADEREFSDLCETLGDRLIDAPEDARKDAAFCYLAGSKLEKVVGIWISELQQQEDASAQTQSESSAFSLHAKALQDLIEKVTIFRRVVNFQDSELNKTSDWKLEALYTRYLEYADIVAAHGQLSAAQRYLDLLPVQYPEANVARGRIQQATKKTAAPVAQQQSQSRSATQKMAAPAAMGFQPATAATSYQPPAPTSGYQPPAAATGYQPPVSSAAPIASSSPSKPLNQPSAPYSIPQPTPFATNPYAPSQPQASGQPANPYAPAGYQPTQQMRSTPGPMGQQGYGVAPPPRMFNQSPSVAPPSQDKNMSNWNDIPDGFVKPPTSRRATPSVPPQPQTYGQPMPSGQGIPPPVVPPFGARRGSPAPPPPPKGSAAPPPRVMSPLGASERPSSGGNNPYAPPGNNFSAPSAPNVPSMGSSMIPPPIARGASPFTAPPTSAPPPNRYAPAPGAQAPQAPLPGRPNVAPPPSSVSQYSAPAANPYAPSRSQQAPNSNSYAPQQGPPTGQSRQSFSTTAPPPPPTAVSTAPPPVSQPAATRPGTADSQTRASAAAARKYPKGDRSHIPSEAQPIVNILSAQMTQVKGRAPSSYKAQVDDTEKRLNILFDHLNNEDLIKPDTVRQLVELSMALEQRDFAHASEIQMEVHRDKVEECGNWMVGVKRLVSMCRATA